MKETVLLKLSGEALAKQGGTGIDMAKVQTIAYEIKALSELGVSIGVVIGAGNMWRGRDASTIGMDRITADQMGMIGTIFNAMALYGAFESINVNAKVMTSIPVGNFTEPYNQKLAGKSLEKGDIVIFGGGTGSPYFSTDTTAALRALEIGATKILMAKNGVDGVYDSDPKTNKEAKRFTKITYDELLKYHLQVMDLTAATLCSDNNVETIVFDMGVKGNIKKVIEHPEIGTIISK